MSDNFNPLDFVDLPKPKGDTAIKIIVSELQDFQKTLNENQEVFITTAGCGFRLYAFRSHGDYVVMQGVDDYGFTCRHVCNIHQLSISFRAVPKLEEQARRIGFVINDRE